jgi:uncharacterized damage-inducible protein DinB
MFTPTNGQCMTTMTTTKIARPGTEEHAPYYGKYVALVPDGDLIGLLQNQNAETLRLLRAAPAEKADHAYAPGKWTVKEVIGHLIDAERIFAYRALRFARGDATDLPGFDENTYVPNGGFSRRTMADLLAEFECVRGSTIHLAKHLDEQALSRRGSANGNGVSVRALLYIVSGHERHHVALLRERYGV